MVLKRKFPKQFFQRRIKIMSHVVIIELEVKSLSALNQACKGLGCTFVKDQKTYAWWGRHEGDYPIPEGMTKEELGKCNHAIKVPGASWEIGVIKEKDKEFYRLIYDFYGGRGRDIEKVCGDKLGKLKGAYTISELKEKLKTKRAKHREENKVNEKGQKIRRFVINT
jgi:hypothetical protein